MQFQKLALAAAFTLVAAVYSPAVRPSEAKVLPPIAQLSNTTAEADRLFREGDAQQWDAAIASWQQALILYRQSADRLGEMKTLTALGNGYMGLDDYPKAIASYQSALAIAKDMKARKMESFLQLRSGMAYFLNEEYGNATTAAESSALLARELKLPEIEGQALMILGAAHYRLGNSAQAIESLQASLPILQSVGDEKGVELVQRLLNGVSQSSRRAF
jgi:Tetratricopeptide repeat